MLERSRKTKDPCGDCGLHKNLCICSQRPALILRTQILLIIHARELKRTTNTGRLAVQAIKGSKMVVRGRGPVDLREHLAPDHRPLLLFPAEGARELTPELLEDNDPRPIQLLVPDGNWRQASKVHTRHPEIKDIPRVMIADPNLASHHLRTETTDHGMSTLQAIARALLVFEGPQAYAPLEDFYQAKLRATLVGRGHVFRPG